MNNLKTARLDKGLSQQNVADYMNINQSTYSYWESGRSKIDNVSIKKLSKLFGVSVDYLLNNSDRKGILIPVLGQVVAGIPIEAVEDIIDYEEITKEMASQGNYFALRIKGNSMEPRIKENDIVIVKKQCSVESGDIAVVLVNGNDATVKKFVKHENGISLVSNNGAYEPMFYTFKECEELPVQVLGKVVELRAKF